MRRNLSRNPTGFTFIEILVSIAIVAVLALLAIPNYRLHLAKSRQNEARGRLTEIYQAEKMFYSEHKSYTYCLFQAGYSPAAEETRYYLTGFFNEGGDGCGLGSCWYKDFEKKETCAASNIPWGDDGTRNDATVSMNRWANSQLKGAGVPGAYSVSRDQFNAVAFGSVNANSLLFDIWEINENGEITNPQTGL